MSRAICGNCKGPWGKCTCSAHAPRSVGGLFLFALILRSGQAESPRHAAELTRGILGAS